MVLQCCICDDSPEAVKITEQKAKKVFNDRNIASELFTYTNSSEFLFDFDNTERRIDLLILDIEMPKVSGLEVATKIKKSHKNCRIIFLTSYLNYAVDGYELEIFRFVPKAEIETRLEHTISDAVNLIDFESHRCYLVQKHDFCEKIPYKDILYIKKSVKNSVIVLEGCEPVTVRKPLSVVFEELASEDFIYIDRSCIANMANVRKIDRYWWICRNGEKIQISHSSYSKIQSKLMEFWGRKILND